MRKFNSKTYAILVAVGDYHDVNIVNLPTYQTDLSFMETSLTQGLMVDPDNIRVLGEKGSVFAKEFALALKSFSEMLLDEDSLIFYFSGHGRKSELVFSDMSLQLDSCLEYLSKIRCKNKLIILDCCYSGNFQIDGPKQMSFEDTIRSFVGNGIAIMASSAADEVSRLGIGMKRSLYTEFVGTAMMSKRKVRKDSLSLEDINSDVFYMMDIWNEQHPDRKQNPIFRSSLGGTIYFKVADYIPYKQKNIYLETDKYTIYSAKPLSTSRYKRIAIFVIYDNVKGISSLPEITREIANIVKCENIFSSEVGEKSFGTKPAHAIWCYFGKDESDLIQHLHYAYTIWTANDEMKKTYYKDNRNAQVIDGIYVYTNASYSLVKKLHTPTISREEFITENRKLLAEIVSMAEHFIGELRETVNKTVGIEEIQKKYQKWIQDVRKKYILLSEIDSVPDDLYAWANEIYDLAGWVLDLSLLFEGKIGESELWLINNSIRQYNESLERLKELDDAI